MSSTLYLLRQQPDRISPALFQAGDAGMDIVLIEQAASSPSSVKGVAVVAEGVTSDHSHPTITYDDLVEKIFSVEQVIVI